MCLKTWHKSNPNREALLRHKRNKVEKVTEKLYNVLGGKRNEEIEGLDVETVKNDISTNRKKDTNRYGYRRYNDVKELENSSFSLQEHKQKQLDIILKNNPVNDDYHTWIRNIDDVKTFEETLQDDDYKEYYEEGEDFDETYTADMAKEALESGKIEVYSSYPIGQGVFVSPSKMEAESYSGNGKVYSKKVKLEDVAWIDPTQGHYAKVNKNIIN